MGASQSGPTPAPEPWVRGKWRHNALRLAVVGAHGCGKGTLIQVAAGKPWHAPNDFLADVNVDFKIIFRSLFTSRPSPGDEPVRLVLWPAQHFTMRPDARAHGPGYLKRALRSLLRDKHGVLLCFDVTDRESFAFLRPLGEAVALVSGAHCTATVVGLKADALQGERAVSEEEGRAMADLLGAGYAECSAKTGEGVEEAIRQAAEEAAYALQFATVGAFELRDGPGQITALLRV